MEIFGFILIVLIALVVISIRQINEYERGVLFRFGKFNKILLPGWNLVFPVIDSFKKVDVRTKAVDVPEQDAITKDNVSVLLKLKDSNMQLVNLLKLQCEMQLVLYHLMSY